jgi:hypothetical protein
LCCWSCRFRSHWKRTTSSKNLKQHRILRTSIKKYNIPSPIEKCITSWRVFQEPIKTVARKIFCDWRCSWIGVVSWSRVCLGSIN